MGTKLKDVKAVVDCQQEISLPLDFSFKAVNIFTDLLRERPRQRGGQGVLVLEDELSAGGSTDTVDIAQSISPALKVNNNMLVDWEGFSDAVGRLLVNAASNLRWLDLSFNDLRTIDSALLELPNLTMLYLHGNNIGRIAEVDKLSGLTKLKSLSLHGNPIEVSSGYRFHVLSRVPQLQTFDFSGITKADRTSASTWNTMIAPKHRTKKPKSKDDDL